MRTSWGSSITLTSFRTLTSDTHWIGTWICSRVVQNTMEQRNHTSCRETIPDRSPNKSLNRMHWFTFLKGYSNLHWEGEVEEKQVGSRKCEDRIGHRDPATYRQVLVDKEETNRGYLYRYIVCAGLLNMLTGKQTKNHTGLQSKQVLRVLCSELKFYQNFDKQFIVLVIR